MSEDFLVFFFICMTKPLIVHLDRSPDHSPFRSPLLFSISNRSPSCQMQLRFWVKRLGVVLGVVLGVHLGVAC